MQQRQWRWQDSYWPLSLQAQSTQGAGCDAQRDTRKWDLLMWMGVSTLHASNVASRVLCGLGLTVPSLHPACCEDLQACHVCCVNRQCAHTDTHAGITGTSPLLWILLTGREYQPVPLSSVPPTHRDLAWYLCSFLFVYPVWCNVMRRTCVLLSSVTLWEEPPPHKTACYLLLKDREYQPVSSEVSLPISPTQGDLRAPFTHLVWCHFMRSTRNDGQQERANGTTSGGKSGGGQTKWTYTCQIEGSYQVIETRLRVRASKQKNWKT